MVQLYRSGGIWRTPCVGKAIGNRTTSRTRATAVEAAASASAGGSIGIGTIVIALVGGADLRHQPAHHPGHPERRRARSRRCSRGPRQGAARQRPRCAKFVSTVLADTEDVWSSCSSQGGATYQQPQLVLFRGADAHRLRHRPVGHGPVLLPGRPEGLHRPGLLRHPEDRLGAPGDFAQAYVIAHEVGHHVQNQLGITDKVERMRGQRSARRRTTP